METRRILDWPRKRPPIQNPKSGCPGVPWAFQNRPGFTLVEVLVAVAVLAIGISAGVRALGAMARSSAAAEDRETAVRLAGERLAVLESGIETGTGNAEGVFETEPRFRWQQSISASSEQTGVLETTVTVTWLDGAVERHYAVTTYLLDTPTETTTTTGGEQ
jgi:general secretion pathway protein I